jgi:hypothetical protein
MKKIFFTILVFAFCIGLQGQKITALTEATTAPTGSLLIVRSGTTGDVLKRITEANLFSPLLKVKDSTAYVNSYMSRFDAVTGLALKVNISDTAGMLTRYARLLEVYQAIADSLNALRNSGVPGVLLADSNVYDGGYTTPYGVDLQIAASGGTLKDNLLRGIQALGSTIKAIPMGCDAIGSQSTALIDGLAFWQPIYIDEATTITGVKWVNATAGDYVADNNNRIGLYSVSGTTYTLVASCANDGNLWKGTANTLNTKAFSAPYAAAKGVYYLCFLYNTSAETAAPAIFAGADVGAYASILLFSDHQLSGYSSQTDIPNSEVTGDIAGYTKIAAIFLY